MNFEALVLACGVLSMDHAYHISRFRDEYSVRAVACAVNRINQEKVKPVPKGLDDVPENLKHPNRKEKK